MNRMFRQAGRLGIAMALGLLASAWAAAHDSILLEASAGDVNHHDAPVTFVLPANFAGKHFTLTRLDDQQAIPVQWQGPAPGKILWMLDRPLAAGAQRRYRLTRLNQAPAPAPKLTAQAAGGRVVIQHEKRDVLHYHTAVVPSGDPQKPEFGRSGYIHPLFNRAGQAVTGDMSPFHRHQHGVMLAWVNTTFEGRPINFWDCTQQQGKVEHAEVLSLDSGPVFAQVTARIDHVDLTAPNPPKKVLNETWTVQAYDVAQGVLLDLATTQNAASSSSLEINSYHYGGLAFRGAEAWLKQGCECLTREGLDRVQGNATRPGWVAMFGKLDGQMTGVMVMDHPQNFRHPQPVRLHPTLPYFCFAPSALGGFSIEPGKSQLFRYRYYVFTGLLDPSRAAQLWDDYATPVTVRQVN